MLTLLLLLTGGAGVEIKVLDRREAEEMMRSRSLLFGSTGHAEPEKPADPPPTCPQGTVPFVGDGKASIFDQLSITEIHTIADYLEVAGLVDHRFASGLADLVYEDLRAHGGRVIMDSNVGIEYQLLAPAKAEAAAFLSGESGIPPARFAKVTVFRGAASPRDVMQYKVGPLGGATSMAATEMLAAGSWKWARRPENYAMEKAFWQMPVGVTMNTLSRLIAASSSSGEFAGVDGNPYVYLSWWAYPDLGSTDEDRIINVHMMSIPPQAEGDSQGGTLLALPLSFSVHEDPDRPAAEWRVDKVEYCYRLYASAAELASQFSAGATPRLSTIGSNCALEAHSFLRWRRRG